MEYIRIHARHVLFVILCFAAAAGLSACGVGGGGSTAATIVGSAGDGPVSGGTVTVVDVNGAAVTTTPATVTTDTTGHFSFTVPSGAATPLKITVTGGTDVVTNAPPEFPLITAVTSLSTTGSVTGNANPLSTLAVAAAEKLGGGTLSAANLTTATSNVKNTLGFGVDDAIDPFSTPITAANVANVIKAYEAAGELIRRVSSSATSGVATPAAAIAALASDITDGVLDGAAAAGVTGSTATAALASVALTKQAEVSAEVLADTMAVTNGTTGATVVLATASTAALNAAITATQPTVTAPDITAVTINQKFISQAQTAANAANALGGAGTTFATLAANFGSLTAGASSAAIATAGTITVTTTEIANAAAIATNTTQIANAATAAAVATTAANFKLSANSVQLTDYNAAGTAQTAQTVAATSVTGGVMTLPAPTTGLNDANLRNLAQATPTGTSPVLAFGLSNLPVASGTSTVTALLKDGTTVTRTTGQRQVQLVFDVDWTSDGTTLTMTAAAGNATATYYTAAGTAAVTATLTNAAANILSTGGAITVPGAQAQLNAAIANIFSTNNTLGAAMQAATVAAGQNYYYQLDFTNFLLKGLNNNSFTQVKGSFALIDGTAPAAPAITSPAANATVTTNTPTVTGTSEANATVKIYSGTTTLTLVATTTADGSGAWSVTSGNLVNGTHTLSATATDAAGNASAASTGIVITVNGNPTITGAAVDGYVSGATLTVYTDLPLKNQIGTGTTDTGGQFSIQLTQATVPDPMYIKSVGGTDIATGMPAPTMMFTVSGSPSTGLNITPMTNAVYGRVLDGQSLTAAQTGLLTDLGLASNTELYGDPVVTGSLQASMFRALTAGTMGATLAAGNYQMFVMTAGEAQLAGGNSVVTGVTNISTLIDPAKGLFIGPVAFNVAANGDVSGTSGTSLITGKVQGSAIVFNIIDPNTGGANLPPINVTRVVGTIGLNGSVAGNFTDMSGLNLNPPNPSMRKGVFVGSFIPATGVNAAGLATFVNNFYTPGTSTPNAAPDGTGLMNIVARDIFGTGVPVVSWGQASMTAVNFTGATKTVTMTDMLLRRDAGSVAANNGATVTMTFNAGQYVMAGAGNATPTNLVVLEYTLPTGEKLFIATAMGLRRGIYMLVPTGTQAGAGSPVVIGESYMTKASGIVPGLAAGTTYDVTAMAVHAGMPGQTRSSALAGQPMSVGPMPIPAAATGFDAHNGYFDSTIVTGAPELLVFQGSIMAMKQDANNNFADNQFSGGATDDHIRVVEFFESGAMMGEEISGGTVTPPGMPLMTMRNFPSTFVGFFHVNGAPSPSFTGNLNFLARTIYANDFGAFMDAVVSGSLDITTAPTTTGTGAATLAAFDPQGGAINATLSIDATGTKYGVYHMHGQVAGTGAPYVDIYWPIGSKKATYVLSTSATGNVSEVGEAYITQ